MVSGISDADSSRETVSREYPGARETRTECVFVHLSEEVYIFKQSFADQTNRGLLFLKGFAFQRPPTLNKAVAAQFTHSGCGKLGKDGEDGGLVEGDAEFGEVLHGARGADDVGTVRCIFCQVCKFGISDWISLALREGKGIPRYLSKTLFRAVDVLLLPPGAETPEKYLSGE